MRLTKKQITNVCLYSTWWQPVIGGANVPALNRLLRSRNIFLSDRIVTGDMTIVDGNGAEQQLRIASASTLTRVPRNSYVWLVESALSDEATHVLLEEQRLNNSAQAMNHS